ncbi:hypothetical protein FOXG_17302 [Fusarium oxysporum f. sp. lycopersici 4287]|uniref:Uncharacterized protein n=2 Tax=Fusarium oxysporum TaxID=5507 RepID=A0A0J9WC12_FUSO4|nr:uncharacterized protein FOXG_17302 [Fusarium oxysporum f. sp. lycopersici 4287]KNB20066.1 hypothetical protein FOXG_17302 [Fusarium oxysporum f. sp. lycopersici 4287]
MANSATHKVRAADIFIAKRRLVPGYQGTSTNDQGLHGFGFGFVGTSNRQNQTHLSYCRKTMYPAILTRAFEKASSCRSYSEPAMLHTLIALSSFHKVFELTGCRT